ncbi:Ig-like domain-containing protein [Longimicrobium sp.]|uniref:Ig-like domain-containing protein n=1 Tax=Longimicrobium sp. TaxID=2029185 RepID=UPI002E360D0B|nr:Ig-like domain-containing protein [Longimicrobium sp.]HEX6036571.1 Ig-like domain-containing protein [Longimicrobium sp.]
MKRILWLPATALLALAACERSSTAVEEEVATVQVMPDQRVLAVSETLQMTAVVRDEGGEEPSDERMADLAWSTSNGAVATVSADGLVTGVAPGTATIRASLEEVEGTVQVTVAPAPAACSTAGAVRSLDVGGSVVLGGVQAATVCLDGGATGKEYVAVPFHAGDLNAGLFTVQMAAQNSISVLVTSPGVSPSLSLAGGRAPDEDFHQGLRARAERALAPYVDDALRVGRGNADGLRPSFTLDLRNAQVGQQVTVNTSVESCGQPSNRTGRVVAVGTRSVVLADVSNPSGGLTDAQYASFAAGFDTLVYPTITAAFGDPNDVDKNGKVAIFYTSAVNALTPPGSSSYVGGFFHPRDLFPTKTQDGLSACEGSNFAEMFYMLVPDPTGSVNNNVFSRDLVLQTSLGTIAHEFQHLINASRRLYNVRTTHWNEETWLNEGLSHIAEEVMFYHMSGLAPRQNLGPDQITASARVRSAFVSYMDQNFRRFESYLEDHENQSPYDAASSDDNDLATRGATWSFLRYAADHRASGTDAALWRDLVEADVTGFANLQQALGTDPRPMVRDWTTSVFTDDAVSGLEARFTQPSWRYRSFFNTYPVTTRNLAGGGQTSVMIKSGSGTYGRFGVAPAQTATFTARTSTGAPLPSQVYVTIVRTR